MIESIKKLLDRIKENDWSVTISENYIVIGKYSPAGQDFNFDIDMTDFEGKDDNTAASLFVEAIRTEYDNYDVSYEAYIWLGNDGHGINGAPYDMRDVYNDMEAVKAMLWDLYNDLNGFFTASLVQRFTKEKKHGN